VKEKDKEKEKRATATTTAGTNILTTKLQQKLDTTTKLNAS